MRTAAFLILLALLAMTPLASVSQTNSPQSPVEISGEARHHFKFENEFVRIWDVTVPGGDSTLWHAHRNDNVVVIFGDANLRIETLGGAPSESVWKFGEVRFGKATYVHRAMNIGATPFHNLTIELLKSPGLWPGVAKLAGQTKREPVFENDRLRAYRLSLAPGESSDLHTHHLPGLAVTLSAGQIEIVTAGKDQPDRLELAAADARWRAGAVTHQIKNIGNTRFEAVDIEFK
jgi:quercetin dioxygenase-like cupin family protein